MALTTAGEIPTGIWSGAAADPANIQEWQKWYQANIGKTILVNGQPVTINQDITPGQLWNAFQADQVGWGNIAEPQAPTTPGGIPETAALQQMAQIDPVTEALRNQVAGSYATSLQNAAAPTPGVLQSYLDLYQQVDPEGYAQRAALGGQVSDYLTGAKSQYDLGSQLDPMMQRQIEQQVRAGQAARGNIYGTPQMVEEAMTTGQAGEALRRQRAADYANALGMGQSYLGSGLGLGDTALNLYNQQQNQLRANQGAALSYLGSGQTPFQAGSNYYQQALQNAATAAGGGPSYNPAQQTPYYAGGGAPSYPQYGLDIGAQAQNYYTALNNANLAAYGYSQAGQKQGGGATGAGIGALGGAASGALAGSVIPGWGTAVGAIGGAIAGGLKGYYS